MRGTYREARLNIFTRNKTLEKTSNDNLFLLMSNTILVAALAISVGALIMRHENTILVPPQLDRSVTVGWNTADGAYIKSFAMYVATLAGNITPKNVNFVTENLSTLVSPRIYADVRKGLLAQAKNSNFVRNAGSTHFIVNSMIYEDLTGRVYVMGSLKTDGANNANQVKLVIYDMVIKMVDGKPVVDAITNYEGSEPHNDKYNALHAVEIKAREAQLRELQN